MVEIRYALQLINTPLAWIIVASAEGLRMEAGGPVASSCESQEILSGLGRSW